MGVINRSDDSFYAPQSTLAKAIDQAATMLNHGADMLDIGGEATNPTIKLGSGPSLNLELDRVIPTVEALHTRFDTLISVDTSNTDVMQAAIAAGAGMINDQRALQATGAKQLLAKHGIPVCLMHFAAERQPQSSTASELLQQILHELCLQITQCTHCGIAAHQIIIDPGFGQGNYGKNVAENFYLLAHLEQLVALGYPVLVGWSRKSMIGDVMGGLPPSERLPGSIASALYAANQGARLLRVHDVAATRQALTVWQHAQQQRLDTTLTTSTLQHKDTSPP